MMRDKADFEKDYDLLANACGLASSLFWDYYRPSEVEPMAPQAVKLRPDRDELYPK